MTNTVKKTSKKTSSDKAAKVRTDRAPLLLSVAKAAFGESRATSLADHAIQRAGMTQEDTRIAYICGYLAGRLLTDPEWNEPMMKAMRDIMEKKGAGSQDAERRTAVQETAYAAARKAWSRHLAKTGQVTTQTRGANSKVKGAKAAKGKVAPVVAKPGGFDTAAETHAYYLTQLDAMLSVDKKHADQKGRNTGWAEALANCRTIIASLKPGE